MESVTKLFSDMIGVVVIMVVLSGLMSWFVMLLWNGCLISAIDGVHQITWLQAWGLTILCALLFKSSYSKS